MDLERNLINLHEDLVAGSYRPGRSICFVVTRPKAREVWAAAFRDRIVHHLLYNHIGASIEAKFIADSCACIPERGTLYAAERLEAKVRSVTQNWRRPAHYLKMDLANFFVAIDKRVLTNQLVRLIDEPWWRRLALQVLWHDPRVDYEVRSRRGLFNKVPQHKRLTAQTAHLGLPIGNLSSQFFANIYLNDLDQFVKHQLRAKHYIRYVDDFLLLHDSPQACPSRTRCSPHTYRRNQAIAHFSRCSHERTSDPIQRADGSSHPGRPEDGHPPGDEAAARLPRLNGRSQYAIQDA
ncbi:reverse transcriptase domain protein [Pseudomonas aeruginosa]|nr:reverse transcriptase domain protein [Pseudomonas aeruginosa]